MFYRTFFFFFLNKGNINKYSKIIDLRLMKFKVGFNIILNYRLFKKFKLLGNNKVNHLTTKF